MWIALKLHTTGLSVENDCIVHIECTTESSPLFASHVRSTIPWRQDMARAVQIHKIDRETMESAPEWTHVLDAWFSWLSTYCAQSTEWLLVAHNGLLFDFAFLFKAAQQVPHPCWDLLRQHAKLVDTIELSTQLVNKGKVSQKSFPALLKYVEQNNLRAQTPKLVTKQVLHCVRMWEHSSFLLTKHAWPAQPCKQAADQPVHTPNDKNVVDKTIVNKTVDLWTSLARASLLSSDIISKKEKVFDKKNSPLQLLQTWLHESCARHQQALREICTTVFPFAASTTSEESIVVPMEDEKVQITFDLIPDATVSAKRLLECSQNDPVIVKTLRRLGQYSVHIGCVE